MRDPSEIKGKNYYKKEMRPKISHFRSPKFRASRFGAKKRGEEKKKKRKRYGTKYRSLVL